HRELTRVADEVLPRLIARFGASRLGELEIRRGAWRVRLRRAPDATVDVLVPSRRGTRSATGTSSTPPSSNRGATTLSPTDSPVDGTGPGTAREERGRVIVKSPAVGYFQPAADREVGRAIRQGDVLGFVDVLGVRQDVVAEADGVIGRMLVDPGQAVEYGQELVRIDRIEPARPASDLVGVTA
ncbi:MAG: acetyl-CoA carboxylase biotin carboxyl carrier protein, partial [Candidatus Limnocylindrales bacterium]